jgi:hypothetical protein
LIAVPFVANSLSSSLQLFAASGRLFFIPGVPNGRSQRERRKRPSPSASGTGERGVKVDQKIVAIVVFTQQVEDIYVAEQARAAGAPVPIPRLVHYQVTLDPAQISPSGRLIRLGAAGDEILGWQPLDSMEIVEVVARYEGDTLVTVPKGESP